MHCHLLRPSLWRSIAPCGGSLEVQLDVLDVPRPVLLSQSQHLKDLPDIQGVQGFNLYLIHVLSADRVYPD